MSKSYNYDYDCNNNDDKQWNLSLHINTRDNIKKGPALISIVDPSIGGAT